MSGRAIVITSGKGGVGKTTATANLGLGLARHDRKVVLVDGDIGLRNLDIIMGLENRIVYHLVDVVRGRCQVRQALVKDKRFPHLALLPASQVDQKEAISPEQMRELAAQLKEEFDFVLIDCPAGIEQGFRDGRPAVDYQPHGHRDGATRRHVGSTRRTRYSSGESPRDRAGRR